MTRWPSTLLLLLAFVAVVGCDHTTKHFAVTRLGDAQTVDLVPGVLELRKVANTDTAFNLLGRVLEPSGRRAVILCLQAAAIAAIVAMVVRRRRESGVLERAASALLLGGAVGNFGDRLVRGHVIDFIRVTYWPVFNVADIALCVGIGLLVIARGSLSTRTARG